MMDLDMDTQYINCLVYDYMAKVDTKLAKKFMKEAKVTEQLPPGSPGIGDILKHFNETSKKMIKRKIELVEEESTFPKKPKKEKITEKDEASAESVPGGKSKIFIRNISKTVVYEDLQAKFEQFGEVADFVNPGRGFSFLTFSSAEAAIACVAALNNTEMAGKTVEMSIARGKQAAGTDTPKNAKGCKLFVHGIKKKTGNNELQAAFEKFGTVTYSLNPGKGFAFVTFSTPQEATAAAEALNGKEVCGNVVKVNVSNPNAVPKGDRNVKDGDKAGQTKNKTPLESVRLYVNNVSKNAKQADLKSAFSAHGTVKEVHTRAKGFAFVTFATVDEARAAKEAMNGQEVLGKEIQCNYAEVKKFQKGKEKS